MYEPDAKSGKALHPGAIASAGVLSWGEDCQKQVKTNTYPAFRRKIQHNPLQPLGSLQMESLT